MILIPIGWVLSLKYLKGSNRDHYFLVDINDLPMYVWNRFVALYADDIKLYSQTK